MESTIAGPTGELRMEQEVIDVSCMGPTIDRNWRHTDRNGHEHYYERGSYPTLVEVPKPGLWVRRTGRWALRPRDRRLPRYFGPSDYRCRICREIIRPGLIPGGVCQTMPGLRAYYFNDQPITEPEFNAIRERWRHAQGR